MRSWIKGVMAIGDDAMASGNNSIALGTSAKAGYLEKTRNEDSVTMTGSAKRITKLTSTRSVNNAVAIGTESSVQSDEDIAVGYRAATVRSSIISCPVPDRWQSAATAILTEAGAMWQSVPAQRRI